MACASKNGFMTKFGKLKLGKLGIHFLGCSPFPHLSILVFTLYFYQDNTNRTVKALNFLS